MDLHLLDTTVFKRLNERHLPDYPSARKIVDAFESGRFCMASTFVVAKELHDERIPPNVRSVLLKEYYACQPRFIETLKSREYDRAWKLAWNYIQRLKKEDAKKHFDDALNYAWASIGGCKSFVTVNRRGILTEDYGSTLEGSNKKFRLPVVRICDIENFCFTFLEKTSSQLQRKERN